jgi:hypothetical protein
VAVAGVGLAVALPFVAALGWDGYSHRSQYISELGARGAPNGAAVSVAFLAVGVLFAAWGAVTAPRVAGVIGLGTAVAVWLAGGGLAASYAVSAVARCEPGCPDEDVGAAQAVHNLVSTAGYTLAIAALVVFGLAVRRWPWAPARRVGGGGLVAAPVLVAMGLAVVAAGDWRGLLQRLLDAGLYAWILAVTYVAVTVPTNADATPPVVGPAGPHAG